MTPEFPYEFSPSLAGIAQALAAAQAELEDAKKDAVNPHFKNKYATLSSVREAITKVFSKHGLSVVQPFEPHGPDGVCIVTLLMHKSGEWIRSKLYIPVSKKDAQGFGSAISYGRRYALAAIANIASDDDDDAEVAVKEPAKAKHTTTKAPPAVSNGKPDVETLAKMLEASNDAKSLSVASMAVVHAKDKITEPDRERLRGLYEAAMRRIETEQAHAAGVL